LLIPARLLRVRIRSSRCWLTASAISPPVSVSLRPLLPYVCASFSGCYSRVSNRDSRVSTETCYSPTSCLSASLLYFLYVPLYLVYCCQSLLTLLPPYATYSIRVWVLMYLLYSTHSMPAYAPYSICLLVCGIRRVVTTTLYAIDRHREHEEREMRQKVVCVSLLAIEGRVSLSPCHRAGYGIE